MAFNILGINEKLKNKIIQEANTKIDELVIPTQQIIENKYILYPQLYTDSIASLINKAKNDVHQWKKSAE
jgi:hypothetical protein